MQKKLVNKTPALLWRNDRETLQNMGACRSVSRQEDEDDRYDLGMFKCPSCGRIFRGLLARRKWELEVQRFNRL